MVRQRYHQYNLMRSASEDLIAAARERVASAATGGRKATDYAVFHELLERLTQLDAAGLGPELARLRYALGLAPPQSPTRWGWIRALLRRAFTPLFWRVLRAGRSADPFEALYEMLVLVVEWQVATQRRVSEVLAELRARLEALEASRNTRGQ